MPKQSSWRLPAENQWKHASMHLCLLAGAMSVSLLSDHATLSWSHSVEKQLWEEDWRTTPAGLVIDEARVTGSGAGMEAGEDAVLREGFWRWKPGLPPIREIRLRRSGATADYRICQDGRCRPLSDLLPGDADPVTLTSCE
jgi:hypothetical protein